MPHDVVVVMEDGSRRVFPWWTEAGNLMVRGRVCVQFIGPRQKNVKRQSS